MNPNSTYQSYDEDFVQTRNQHYILSENYRWIHTHPAYRIYAAALYQIAKAFIFLYAKLSLRLTVVSSVDLRDFARTGIVLYANHTHPISDALTPILLCRPKRGYTISSPANLGIPLLGRLLPGLGILPLPSRKEQKTEFHRAVGRRIQERACIVVYPEGHLWPYHTEIRPFTPASFRYPAEYHVPAFSAVTTYQKKRFGKKPKLTIYLDGPYYPEENCSFEEQKIGLRNTVSACMTQRSQNSTYQYITYKKSGEQT